MKKIKKINRVKNLKRILVLSVSAVIIASGTAFATIGSLREQQQNAAAQRAIYLDNLRRTDSSISEAEIEIYLLEHTLLEIIEELDELNRRLSETSNNLEDTEIALEMAIKDREEMEQILIKRLRAMYMAGPSTYVEMLFGATSIADFLRRLEYANRIAEHDQNLVYNFLKIEDTIEAKRNEIAIEYAYLVALERTVEQRRIEHEAAFNDVQTRIEALGTERRLQAQGLNRMDYYYEQLAVQIRREERAARARESASVVSNNRVVATTTGRDGEMRWPVPSRDRISSPFGPRRSPISGRNENHSGIDIPAPRGNDIIAARAGEVTFSGWQNGFGNTIVIDHGEGVTTLSAHNNRNLVSVGTFVEEGQVIGAIGSTGWSTGPHLHFEVRINGTPVNPMGRFLE